MHKTLDIIRTEHQALAAVLHALRMVVGEIREGRLAPDFRLLAAMTEYITEVPEVLHHPKEDRVIFRILRERSAQAGVLIDTLEEEHRQGFELTRELERALIRYQSRGDEGFARFDDTVARYLAFNWKHLNREEKELIPLARQALSDADWADADAEFEANGDPWAGPDKEYADLFSRIVRMTPPPLGLGA